MKQSDQDTQDGTIGFDPKLAGHAKAAHSHTTSFGRGLPEKLPVPNEEAAGQEEGGRPRQPSSSTTGRMLRPNQKMPATTPQDKPSGGPAREEKKEDK